MIHSGAGATLVAVGVLQLRKSAKYCYLLSYLRLEMGLECCRASHQRLTKIRPGSDAVSKFLQDDLHWLDVPRRVSCKV